MSEQQDLINEFRAVADVPEERARFFLESAAWQLPLALSSFFDAGGAGSSETPEVNMDADYEPPQEDPDDEEEAVPAYKTRLGASKPATKSGSSRTTRSSKFSSIKDLAEEEQDDEDEGQRYYAGGSEHSGELIVGPPRKKKTNEEITKDLFAEAKKHGAESVEPGDRSQAKPKAKYFTGGGYKLGESEDSSEFVPGSEVPEERGPVNVILKLWSNGFTVDDGPIRDFNDPANAEFLASIKKGQIPQELLKGARRGEVHVDMEDHRQEEYKAPKKKLKPFSGQGHMLGSPAPAVSFGATAAVPQTSSVDPPIQVNQSEPTTSIQIRLANGQRLVQKFNHTHRVEDIRSFLISKNPQMASQPFMLMTTFPNKELTDGEQTVADANLLNAVIVQRNK